MRGRVECSWTNTDISVPPTESDVDHKLTVRTVVQHNAPIGRTWVRPGGVVAPLCDGRRLLEPLLAKFDLQNPSAILRKIRLTRQAAWLVTTPAGHKLTPAIVAGQTISGLSLRPTGLRGPRPRPCSRGLPCHRHCLHAPRSSASADLQCHRNQCDAPRLSLLCRIQKEEVGRCLLPCNGKDRPKTSRLWLSQLRCR